jgi:hypothetical protein
MGNSHIQSKTSGGELQVRELLIEAIAASKLAVLVSA